MPVGSGEVLSGAVINPSSVIIAGPSGGATIQAGGAPTQVPGGHTVSVDPAASNIVIDGQEHALPVQESSSTSEGNLENIYPAAVTPGSGPYVPPGGSAQNQPVAQPDSPDVQQNQAGQIAPPAAQAVPIATTIGGHVITAIPSSPSAIVIDGQIITQGANPVVVSNTPIAYHANGDLVFGASTVPNILPTLVAPSSLTTTTVANHAVIISPSKPNAIQIDGQMISQGAEPVTLSGTPVAYHSNGDIVIGTSTIPNILPSSLAPPSIPFTTSIGNYVVANIPSSPNAILVDGQTISYGTPSATISGTPVAYQANGNLILGTATISNVLPSNAYLSPSPPPPAVLTIDGQVATVLPNSAGIAISGTTIVPNGPAVSISGTLSASFGSAGLVVGTSTMHIPSQLSSPALQSQDSMTSITLAGQVFTYALAAPTPTSNKPSSFFIATSVVGFTSTAADGAKSVGSSISFYTSAMSASPSGAQNVGSLVLGGLSASGPGNLGSNSANSRQGSPTLISAAGITSQTPRSGSARISVTIDALGVAFVAMLGSLWICI